MTRAELESRLARYLGLGALADDPNVAAWAPDALNDAQLEIALQFRIPRYQDTVWVNSNPFAVYRQAQSGGILAAVDSQGGKPLAIVDRTRLYAELPDFVSATAQNVPQYLVQHEFGASTLEIHPLPAATPRTLYIFYAAVPAVLANPTTEAWDGQFPEYHEMIALRAAQMLIEADWADPKRAEWINKRYQEKVAMLAEVVAPQAQLHRHNVTEA